MKTLRLILGDQLNAQHSWYASVSESTVYCMFEMRQETDYVKHHIQKVVGFFAAMRDFSKQLEAQGHKVVYLTLDDTTNLQNLEENIKNIINSQGIESFEYQSPDEYRLDTQLKSICSTLSIPSSQVDTEHFYTKRDELSVFYEGKKQFVMERFYRYMRKKHHILMEGEQPEGGEWNYDKSNRNKWKGSPEIPPFLDFKNPVKDILETIHTASDLKTIGRFDDTTFSYPINRTQSLEQLDYFNQNLLVHFGDYQDALHNDGGISISLPSVVCHEPKTNQSQRNCGFCFSTLSSESRRNFNITSRRIYQTSDWLARIYAWNVLGTNARIQNIKYA